MSATQPDPRFSYGDMTDGEAMAHLITDFGHEEVALWHDRNHIISAVDVLYYADAYGDLEDAILLQAFDKSLPKWAHKGLLESGMDIFEAVNCNDLETYTCPACGSEMWTFEIREGDGHTSHNWIDEHGNTHDGWVRHVSSPENHIWNVDPSENDAGILCVACTHDIDHDFPRRLSDTGSVVVHYGETDEVSGFSVWNGLVRWEAEARYGEGNWTDLWGLPGDGPTALPKAFATGNVVSFMEGVGWDEIAEETVVNAIPPTVSSRSARREYRQLAEEWANDEEAHPALDFTYLIDNSTFGNPSLWVADENREALLDEITDLIRRRM